MNAHLRRLAPEVLKPQAAASCLLLAGLLVSGSPAWAILHTTCVNNAIDLRTALAIAGKNGANNDGDNHINLAIGTYSVDNVAFLYVSDKTFTLDITGGYNSDCSQQLTRNPIYTVLSGVGSSDGGIMETNSMGDVSIRYITFKGGITSFGAGALDMNEAGSTGQVIIDYNIFAGNTGAFAVGIGYSSLAQLDGNLFYDNSSNQATFYTYQLNKFFAVNNTFAQNVLSPTHLGALRVSLTNASSNAALSNNILFDAIDTEVSLGDMGAAQLANNATPAADDNPVTSSGTIYSANGFVFPDIDFVSSTNFHLQPTSPGIEKGTLTPPGYNQPGGALPTIDLEDSPRTYNGKVDLGAYERGDDIFRDGLGF